MRTRTRQQRKRSNFQTFSRPQRILVIPDAHNPFMDMHCFNLILQVAKRFKYDFCVLLGDWNDHYSQSRFTKDPTRAQWVTLEYELGVGERNLERLTKALGKQCYKVITLGNHDMHFYRTIAERAPDYHFIIKDFDLYGCKRLGWHVVPYKDAFTLGKVSFTHDLERSGKTAALHAPRDMMGSYIFGHNHTLLSYVCGDKDNIPYLGLSLGWIGDFEKIDYRHKVRAKCDWTKCIGEGLIMEDGSFQIHPRVFLPGHRLIVGGQVFTSTHK